MQGKEEQINRLMQGKSQLEEMCSRYDDLMSKHELVKKELVALKFLKIESMNAKNW